MATIIPRKRKDGMRYTAQVRLKHHGKVIHFESETFDKKSLAKEWGGASRIGTEALWGVGLHALQRSNHKADLGMVSR